MAQTLVFRGVAYATGNDPVDRIIVTASIVISTPTETALAATLGAAYSASCVVSQVKYTRASTGAVTTVTSPGSVTVTFNDVQPNAENGARTCSAPIPAYSSALYTGDAYVVVYDDVIPYSAPPAPVTPSVVGDGLLGKYFNNPDLTGLPVATRVDPTVDFYPFTLAGAGGDELPVGVNPSNFSIRWSGEIESPVTGNVQFRVTHDNGARLYLDGALYVDQWYTEGVVTAVTTSFTWVSAEKHSIWVELEDHGATSAIRLEWKYPGQDWQIVPMARLFSGEGEAPPVAPVLRQSATRVVVINRFPEA